MERLQGLIRLYVEGIVDGMSALERVCREAGISIPADVQAAIDGVRDEGIERLGTKEERRDVSAS